ncbi:MAG: hypothetical protein AAB074_19540 [Planctomycetota bacterium]|mgnify:CR=1 FL=1
MKTTLMNFAVAALLSAACGPARAENICVDATKIYYGDAEGANPATVRAAECFAAIPEWLEIQRRKLTTDDADYWILVSAANARFRKAVEAAAKAGGNGVVAEQGSIRMPEGQAPPADLTKAVVEKIKASAGDSK